MNKHIMKALLVTAGAALVSQAANAASSAGDLILGFDTVSGGSVTSTDDLLVDLGNISNYTGLTSPTVITKFTGADLSTSASLSLNNLSWAVGGESPTQGGANVTPYNVYLSRATSAPGLSTAWTADGSDNSSVGGTLTTLENNEGTALGDSPNAFAQNASVASSFGKELGANYNYSGSWGGSTSQKTSSTFTSGGTQYSYLDLYSVLSNNDVDPGTAGTLLGTFRLGSDASLEFIPVPEPTTYGLVAGAGLLVLCLRSQFRRQQA